MRNNAPGLFTPETLARVLFAELKLPPTARYCVAFSGGADSTAVLHALTRVSGAPLELAALHADHGLAPESAAWAEHCRRFSERLGVPILIRALRVETDPELGPEASARRERYRWFSSVLGENDVLVIAHHRDDQAETLLLRLLHGAGVRGLAGMPALRPLGSGRLARPALGFARADLEAYNAHHGLAWIEDPSNRDTRFDRNFLRREIMPRLLGRWPAAGQSLAQTAARHREAALLLDELAGTDSAACAFSPCRWGSGQRLQLEPLQRLSLARQANALRYLFGRSGPRSPSRRCLDQALDLLVRGPLRGPRRLCCEGLELRYFDGWLEMGPPLPRADRTRRWVWANFPGLLPIPELGLSLAAEPDAAGALVMKWDRAEPPEVRLRCGGELLRLPGRAHRRTLKNLLREARVPPWHRELLPMICAGEEIAAVPGVCVTAAYCPAPGQRGWKLQIIAP